MANTHHCSVRSQLLPCEAGIVFLSCMDRFPLPRALVGWGGLSTTVQLLVWLVRYDPPPYAIVRLGVTGRGTEWVTTYF